MGCWGFKSVDLAGDGGADLIARLAYPVPIEICTLIGLPIEARDQVKRWTDDLVTLGAPGTDGDRQLVCAQFGRVSALPGSTDRGPQALHVLWS